MANPLKKLAGETAIYGLSTILARIINFFFVPFYTRLLTTESYGVVTEFMAYIAVLQVVLVLGLETGCFRFANMKEVNTKSVYTNALFTVLSLGLSFLSLVIVFSDNIACGLGYEGFSACIVYVGFILFLDSVTAILFAKLRQEHRAVKFAIFKTIKILTETFANILLFFYFPAYCQANGGDVWLLNFISPSPDFTYVIFAILISCVISALLFVPTLLNFRFEFDRSLLKKMLIYSMPLMVAALPGILNDFLDRILFRFLDTNPNDWRSSLGIFQAAVKLSVIMSLFVQMFRFAAEPFFFQRTEQTDSKKLYANVMNYFTAFTALVFLGITLFIDIFSLILGENFREGIGVVPIMLLSYMFLGMLFNVSMWYKLSGKTHMAIYITLSGLLVTVVVNILLMPHMSYWASALGHLLSYMVMFGLSAYLGQKYYPVPYSWSKLAYIFVAMFGVYFSSLLVDHLIFEDIDILSGGLLKYMPMFGVHVLWIFVFLGLAYQILRSKEKRA